MPRTKTFKDTGEHINTRILNKSQIDEILKIYSKTKNKELCKIFNCSMSFIIDFAKYYNLKKCKKWLALEKKKIAGRDLNKDSLAEIAKKYHSKREFQYSDGSAYCTANRLGIMEDITKHMVNISFSVPQIITRQITEYIFNEKCKYNDRRTIKPYELDVYFPNLKIAFEYDGKGWHLNDAVNKEKICKEKGILLITLKERSRNYEKDIKNYLLEYLKTINEWCQLNITKKDIIDFKEPIDFPKIFTKEQLKLLRNNTTSFLKENHLHLYQKYVRYNPDNRDFKKEFLKRAEVSKQDIIKRISKYNSLSELIDKDLNAYQQVHRKYRDLLPLYGESVYKKVVCLDTGEVFKSASEAARSMGIYSSGVSRVCRGERDKIGGKRFKYL